MKGKGMAAAIAICFIAVVALVGAYTFSSYKSEMKEQLARAEEEQKEKEREEKKKNSQKLRTRIISYFRSRKKRCRMEAVKNSSRREKLSESTEENPAQTDAAAEQTAGTGTAAYFTEEDTLLWPVDGNVIMNYSMDAEHLLCDT